MIGEAKTLQLDDQKKITVMVVLFFNSGGGVPFI